MLPPLRRAVFGWPPVRPRSATLGGPAERPQQVGSGRLYRGENRTPSGEPRMSYLSRGRNISSRRCLDERHPTLPSIDGEALARTRPYAIECVADVLSDF